MNTRKHRCPLFLAGVFLVLTALACNLPGLATTTEMPPTPTAPQEGEATSTLPSPPATTNTPVPDVSGPGGCTLNARYVADVTVPDDTQLAPGEAFTKVWRVRNSGTCTWEAGTQLIFVSGEQMGGPATVDVPSVAPGSDTDVSVDLVAPTEPGAYRGNWQLQTQDGTRFGSVIYTRIVVAVTPTPSKTPTATVTPTLTITSTTPTTPTVPSPLAAVWDTLGGEEGSLGSPISEATMDRWTVDQQFQQGYIYWRNHNGSPANYVYVLYYQGGTDVTQGAWERYEDTWTEGMDEISCTEAETPNGPIRGFGKVWCDHEPVRLGVGGATEHEDGAYAGFQDFEGGTLLWTTRLHFIYALSTAGTWQRFDETP